MLENVPRIFFFTNAALNYDKNCRAVFSIYKALILLKGQVNEFAKWMIYPPLELLRTLLQHARLMDVNLPKGGLSEVIEILHSISTSCIPRLILNALAAKVSHY